MLEEEQAAQLRDTLDRDPFVVMLRAGWSPRDASLTIHEKLVDQVIELGPLTEEELEAAKETRFAIEQKTHSVYKNFTEAFTDIPAPANTKRPVRLRAIAGGLTTAFAAAAALLLTLRPAATPNWQASRSTANLFHAPFVLGERSVRVDTIARGRAADFRENQFLAWGVK